MLVHTIYFSVGDDTYFYTLSGMTSTRNFNPVLKMINRMLIFLWSEILNDIINPIKWDTHCVMKAAKKP